MLFGKSAVSHPIKEAGGTFRIWASFAIRSWRSILMFPLSYRCTVALLTFISSAICKRVTPSSFLLFFNTVDRFSTNSTPFVHLTIPRAFLKCKRNLQCTYCGSENLEHANFCRKCGSKLKEVCNCWIKKEPYNCGQVKCPGYRLFQAER